MPITVPHNVLIDREQIRTRVGEIGRQLSRDLVGELMNEGEDALTHSGRVVMVPVLTGALVFTADLIREMPLKLSMDMVSVSSYPGTTTESKGAALRGAIPKNLAGKHVVVVDDILDSGRTMKLVTEAIGEQSPASVRSCVLLNKPSRRVVDFKADYVGFEIPDAFVVGYGLDYDGYYRNLPEIIELTGEGL
ncbi:MAG: hypoxanthine phosphoribosyltransferase [Phycisphaerales bacterium]